jgi:pentafunctional AROM polypeptide
LDVEGVDLAADPTHNSATTSGVPSPETSPSVIIIGMRGTGKTYIGDLAAKALDWPCIDADVYFAEHFKQGVREFVQEKGWPAFRDAETEVLQILLKEYPHGHVLSLGGGIVETPAACEVLKEHKKKGPVVHIVRDVDEVVEYLSKETARPQYGEPIVDVYQRRKPRFAECCNYEFINHTGALTQASAQQAAASVEEPSPALGPGPSKGIKEEVDRFFNHITGRRPNLAPPASKERRLYFLSLTYPDITPALRHMNDLTEGVDAVELRVDLLRCPQDIDSAQSGYVPPQAYVADQLAQLRRATSLPVVFTVRTASQGGVFPDGAEKEAFELADLALRLAAEYVDVEISWSEERIRALAKRAGHSQIIASWHDFSGKMKWAAADTLQKYEKAHRLGHIVKLVSYANSMEDNFALYDFVAKRSASPDAKPIIALNMGVEGQMSRILNYSSFSPVTHPLLPSKAAPGQLTFAQVQNGLHLFGQLPAQKFYLFGNPIQHSPSPTLHNTGFRVLGLPHRYQILQTAEVGEEIRKAIRAPDFGGASVTIPFKRDIMGELDELSPHASAIGAVNTIVPCKRTDGTTLLYGDNTDWLGIRACIRARLSDISSAPDVGLVIGAGGTSRAAIYALHDLGTKVIYLYNRTRARAEELARAFPNVRIEIVDVLGEWPGGGAPPAVVVGTVPAAATTIDPAVRDAEFLPSAIFERAAGGVAVDVAYKPEETPLLALAKQSGDGWKTVAGVDMLLEQGYEQFRMWTARRCPRRAVSEAVWQQYRAV